MLALQLMPVVAVVVNGIQVVEEMVEQVVVEMEE
jgi:hypothetical protein